MNERIELEAELTQPTEQLVEAMDAKPQSTLEKHLSGHAQGRAVALRGCAPGLFRALSERLGGAAPGLVRIFELCRTEHPHSAYLRKTVEKDGRKILQTTLYAPVGRLVSEQDEDGAVLERFVRKPEDFETLRGHLKDMELHPAKVSTQAEAAGIAQLGLTPVRDLETRWAGPELTAQALLSQDESAASCLRKLERHLHKKCEEARKTGCRAGLLRDLDFEPAPENYIAHAGRHLEWLKHNGMMPWVEAAKPDAKRLSELCTAGAGAWVRLKDIPEISVPVGMRLVVEVDQGSDLAVLDTEAWKAAVERSDSLIAVVDCLNADNETITAVLNTVLECLKSPQ